MPESRRILIVGATSAMAEACARRWAGSKTEFVLLARNVGRLELVTRDLRTRGARVSSVAFDAASPLECITAISEALRGDSEIDVALIAHGYLPDQRQCETSVEAALAAYQINAASTIACLTLIANKMQSQRHGVIAVIGSVAGDRGRRSNYVYGSAKALLATFLDGLAGRLQSAGVAVINVKPGFVDTPMTAAFKKSALWATPDQVARIIDSRVAAARSGSFYAPSFWWLIMMVIKHLPARILYRLNV